MQINIRRIFSILKSLKFDRPIGQQVGADAPGTAVDLAEAGYLAVGRGFVFHSRHVGVIEHAHFQKTAGIEKFIDPFPGRKLFLIVLAFYFLWPAHLQGLFFV